MGITSRFSIFFALLCIAAISLGLPGCKIYSFSGANIPADIKTVQIDFFPNRANNGPPALAQTFTDRLKLKFISEGNLKQVNSEGDLYFKGYVSGYTFTNMAPSAGVTSSLNRLTIAVTVDFENRKSEKDKWTQTFSRYAEIPASEDIFTIETRLIDEINKQLVDDIFNKALVKW
jgi:hypothetical protein